MIFKPNIKVVKSPEEMTISEAIQYKGHEWKRFSNFMLNLKRASKYITVPVAAALILQPAYAYFYKLNLFGFDNKGGLILEMQTRENYDDIEYSRQLQKKRFLYKELSQKGDERPLNMQQYLLDNNEKIDPPSKSADVIKRAPHYKYF